MELNCDPCDTVHKVTQGQAEKIIYALVFQSADDHTYGVAAKDELSKIRNSDDQVRCIKDILREAEMLSEYGTVVAEAVLRRQDRVDRKRRKEAAT